MTTGKKFAIAAVTFLSAVMIQRASSHSLTFSLADLVTTVVADPPPGADQLSRVQFELQQIDSDVRKQIASAEPGGKTSVEPEIQALKHSIETILADYEKDIDTSEDREAFRRIRPSLDPYLQVVLNEVLPLSRDQKPAAAREKYLSVAEPLQRASLDALSNVIERNRRTGEVDANTILAGGSNTTIWLLGLLLPTVSAASALMFLMVRSINRVAATRATISNEEPKQPAAPASTASKPKLVQPNEAIGVIAAAIGEMSTSSQRIAGIIRQIDDVSFQNNLLALNATLSKRCAEADLAVAEISRLIQLSPEGQSEVDTSTRP